VARELFSPQSSSLLGALRSSAIVSSRSVSSRSLSLLGAYFSRERTPRTSGRPEEGESELNVRPCIARRAVFIDLTSEVFLLHRNKDLINVMLFYSYFSLSPMVSFVSKRRLGHPVLRSVKAVNRRFNCSP
jgi:hypothetical protein